MGVTFFFFFFLFFFFFWFMSHKHSKGYKGAIQLYWWRKTSGTLPCIISGRSDLTLFFMGTYLINLLTKQHLMTKPTWYIDQIWPWPLNWPSPSVKKGRTSNLRIASRMGSNLVRNKPLFPCEKETLHWLLTTVWFQERIWVFLYARSFLRNQTKINSV